MSYRPVELDGDSEPWYVLTIRDGDKAMQTRNTVILLILASAVVISLATLLIVFFVSRNISSPIKNVYSVLKKIKEGDLSSEINVNSQDEIGEMMGMLNQMQEGIKILISNIKEEAAARIRADEESKTKTSFLARMNHEIRTPMNAITGMAELLLRKELSNEARSHVQDIKQAGNNLISIINDILDFSKIESGKLEIVPVNYLLASLFNDTINIIRMRLLEKPIRFYANIDGTIPNSLIGDEVRMRQILINLLSNAVKFTKMGCISLCITIEKRDKKQICLKISVTDTGEGIKPEDKENLFGEFVQLNIGKNYNFEGTGLGLAITKGLCVAMGGDISVESEYGKGSVFTAIIPQGIESESPFAAVTDPEQKKVLIYESRSVYAQSVSWSLANMRVPHTVVTSHDEFVETLRREEWSFVFSGYGLYNKIKPVMENTVFSNGNEPILALMVEWGTEAYIPNVRFVSIPVQALSIANVLNDKHDSKSDFDSFIDYGNVRFYIPQVRLLVVDDLVTNLKVAKGLLMPYQAVVDTCLSGAEAIELIKQHDYDLVFMDHMMPEMDGIQTTVAVRALEGSKYKTLPIIALTANAVFGMREIFMEKGFNDFLSKPIDVSKLDEILDYWIPTEKKIIRGNTAVKIESTRTIAYQPANIPGLNIQQGIAMTGGTTDGYRAVLSLFCKDAESRLPLLQQNRMQRILFITQVHAMKSASASIGAEEVSQKAAELEAAGNAGDFAFIKANLGGFVESLTELVKNIRAALESEDMEKPVGALRTTPLQTTPIPVSLLSELAEALKLQKTSDIDRILGELMQKAPDTKTKEILEQISDYVLMAEFDSAVKIIDELVITLSKE